MPISPPRDPRQKVEAIYRYYQFIAWLLHREESCYPSALYGEYHGPETVAAAWARTAAAIRAGDAPGKLCLYVHLPFCECSCLYCMSGSFRVRGRGPYLDRYLDFLEQEMVLCAGALEGIEVASVYLGGGTPSILAPPQIERVVAALRRHYRLEPASRVIFEASPFTVDEATIAALERAGVYELAFGVQSFEAQVLRQNRRPQDVDQTEEILARAVASDIPSVTADIMVGMPYQSPDSALRSVQRAIELGVDGVMLNEFLPLPYIRFCQEGHAYGEEQHRDKAAALRRIRPVLERAGYRATASGWRRRWDEEDAARVYKTQESSNLLGFGYGAYSHAYGSLKYQLLYPVERFADWIGDDVVAHDAWDLGRRELFERSLRPRYERYRAEHGWSPQTYIGLPMDGKREMHNYAFGHIFDLDLAEFEGRFGRPFAEAFRDALVVLRAKGLLDIRGDRVIAGGDSRADSRVIRALLVDKRYVERMLEITAERYDPDRDYGTLVRHMTRAINVVDG